MRQQQPTNELTQCETKRCSKCGIGKSRDEFCKDKANRDGLQSRCKHCVNIRNQTPEMRDYIKDYKQTPEVKAREKSRDLSRRYNLTLKSKEEMYGRQHGNCAGCRKPMTFVESVVDHCHATNAVRGLLHSHCNWALGSMRDNACDLHNLADYAASFELFSNLSGD